MAKALLSMQSSCPKSKVDATEHVWHLLMQNTIDEAQVLVKLNPKVCNWLFDQYQNQKSHLGKKQECVFDKELGQDVPKDCGYIAQELSCASQSAITCMQVSHDDTKLFYTNAQGELICYSVELDCEKWHKSFKGITTLTCSFNNKFLLTGHADGSVDVIDVNSGDVVKKLFQDNASPIKSILTSPNGATVAIATPVKVTVIDFNTGNKIGETKIISDTVEIGLSDAQLSIYYTMRREVYSTDSSFYTSLSDVVMKAAGNGLYSEKSERLPPSVRTISSDGSFYVQFNPFGINRWVFSIPDAKGRSHIIYSKQQAGIYLGFAKINHSKSAVAIMTEDRLYIYDLRNSTLRYACRAGQDFTQVQTLCLLSDGRSCIVGFKDGTLRMFSTLGSKELYAQMQKLTPYQKILLDEIYQRFIRKNGKKLPLIICPEQLCPQSRAESRPAYMDYKAFKDLPDLIKDIVKNYIFLVPATSKLVVENSQCKKTDELIQDYEKQKQHIQDGIALQKIDQFKGDLLDIDKDYEKYEKDVGGYATTLTRASRFLWNLIAAGLVVSTSIGIYKHFRSQGNDLAVKYAMDVGACNILLSGVICWALKFPCQWLSSWRMRDRKKSLTDQIHQNDQKFNHLMQNLQQESHKKQLKNMLERMIITNNHPVSELQNSITQSLAARYLKRI